MQFPPETALANLLALRDEADGMCGVFSDHGSWLAACWGEAGNAFSLVDTASTPAREVMTIGVPVPIVQRTAWPDRLEIELADGSSLVLGYSGREQLFLQCPDDLPLTVDRTADGPYHRRVRGGWAIGMAPAAEIPANCLEQNKQRWTDWLTSCCEAAPRALEGIERVLFLRALLTLGWNRRGPLGEMHFEAILPTPFGYPGYWAADSWRIAHALAPLDSRAALLQLRAQFSRQAADGMVPDTVRATHGDENWRNTKPPRAAWALLALADTEPEAVRELLPACAMQLDWWHTLRRQDHDTRYRPGGADRESATWDTGWDQSKRFDGIELSRRSPWKLLDIWPVDLNALLLTELRAVRTLAKRFGEENLHGDLRRRTRALEAAFGEHWDGDAELYLDLVPESGSTSWKPLRSLASAYPVWAGLGGQRAVAGLARELASPERFATPMPFPCIAADAKGFLPDGFANGSVLPEHAVTALQAIGPAGKELRERFLQGLDQCASLYECYHPLDGGPVRGERPAYAQSSATAAAILELVCA